MALTNVASQTPSGGQPSAPLRADRVTFSGDNAYPAGGTPDMPTELKAAFPKILPTIVDITGRDSTGQYALSWDSANQKLQILDMSATPPAEVAPGDQSALTFQATVLSK